MKKFNLAIATLLVAGAGLTVSSCGKYEEGPGISLMTKKMRLTGEWDTKSVTYGSVSQQDTDEDAYITFEKDGTFKISDNGIEYTGTWAFSNDKEGIAASFTNGSITTTYQRTILRLTNKELWMEDSNGYIYKAEKR